MQTKIAIKAEADSDSEDERHNAIGQPSQHQERDQEAHDDTGINNGGTGGGGGTGGTGGGGGGAMDNNEDNSVNAKFLRICAILLPKVFIASVFIILIVWIIGFAVRKSKDGLFALVLILNICITLLGAWAIYRYGVIQDQIDLLRSQNNEYKSNIDELKQSKDELKKNVEEMTNTVTSMEKDASLLEEQTKQFEPLLNELKNIAKDNADISMMLDQTNTIFKDMRNSILQNERAHLLSTFYECAFRDEDNTMNKAEYKRFLGRLSKSQREKFESQGTFEQLAGDDEQLDLGEFQELIERVLVDVDHMLRDEFNQQPALDVK